MYHDMAKHLLELPNAKHCSYWRTHSQKEYNINKQGFRSDPFEERKDINVATLGCSNALGWGLEIENRFSSIFCKTIAEETGKTVNDWNLGLGGKSNDYIARMAITCENTIEPDIYLVCFTGISRREYWDCNGSCIDYVPSNFPEYIKRHKPEELFLHKKIHLLNSDWDNVNNAVKNFKTIECVLKDKIWFYTFSSGGEKGGTTNGSIASVIPQEKYVDYFEVKDKAEDDSHPGIKSHKAMAENFLEGYLNETISKSHVERSDKVVRYL